MTLVTVVIPVSPKHAASQLYREAVASVEAQTIPASIILEFDHTGQGAAKTRNAGTAKVKTPFVIWLDADDLLKPTFIEDCLTYYKPGSYVYTDWVVNGLVMTTPDCLHMHDNGQEHVITTLMPVTAWQSTGGFDETLDTLEDEDFYRKLHAYGWCGVRCPEHLIHYRRHNGESLVNKDVIPAAIQQQRVAEKHALFTSRYRRFYMLQRGRDCGCGGSPSAPAKQVTTGEQQPNDVLVEAMYSPQRVEGFVTRRLYPRTGLGATMWVDIDDAKARPDLFRILTEKPENISPDVDTVKRLVDGAIAQQNEPQPDYTSMTMRELKAEAEKRGLVVAGTGKNGRIKKDDYLAALA